MTNCPQCNNEAQYVEDYSAWYCHTCQQYLPQDQGAAAAAPAAGGYGGQQTIAQQLLSDSHFTIKQKIIARAPKYFVRNSSDEQVAFVQQKLMKLKEDIRIYSDESKTTEIMSIRQANIMDFSGSYNVVDSQSGEVVGILKRKGLKSMLKDEWKILDASQNEIGKIKEQGGIMWFLRRFKFPFLPYKYFIEISDQRIGTVTEKFQIAGQTYLVDMEPNANLDPRLSVAIGLMIDIGEGE